MHALKAHSTAWDPVLFPSRFVDGLKEEIRAAVMLHQPKDLDAAVSLALLQEEALDIIKKSKRSDVPYHGARTPYRVPTAPAVAGDKHNTPYMAARTPSVAEDNIGVEGTRPASLPVSDDKAVNLKNYRKSRGLCFVCGEKWGPVHKCSTSVLHVVQEMLEALGFDTMEEEPPPDGSGAVLHVMSQAAVAGAVAPNTFRLLGQIQKQQVSMLIDSGSSHCFVSEDIASHLQGVMKSVSPFTVKIPDGALMTCDRELVDCEWWCQGTTFRTNLKVLPLGCYDVIIGMDWLQSHNPMGIDWVGRRLAF
jgi:hypothetical protein